MPFTYDPLFAVDPQNPSNVAKNATITIFDPADATQAAVTITDPTGSPLPNPITVDAAGMGPAFQHPTLARVGWKGAGFTGYFTSYEGMFNETKAAKDAAVAAIATATAAGANAAAAAASALDGAVTDAETAKTAAVAAASLVGAPADTAIAAAVNGNGATKTALNAVIAGATDPLKPLLTRPAVTVTPAVRAVSDSIVHVRVGPATNAVMLRPTDLTRQVTIIQNLGANAMMVAESTNGSFTPPTTGHVSVAAGSEYVTSSARSVWAYMSTTAATARVYTAQGA